MVSSIGSDSFDDWDNDYFRTASSKFHDTTFVATHALDNAAQVYLVARNDKRDPRFEADVKTGIKGRFGGDEGLKIETYLEGAVSHKDGAYVKGNISRYSDGTGDFDAVAGYKGKVGPKRS